MDSVAAAVAKYLGSARGAQSSFARRVGHSRGFVSNVLAGRNVPSDPARWADVLGMSPADRAAFLRDVHLVGASAEVREAVASFREGAPVATAFFDQHAPGLVEYSARITSMEATITELRNRLASIAALAAPETPAPQPPPAQMGPMLQLPARVKK